MAKAGERKFDVYGADENGDLWIVGTDNEDAVETIKQTLIESGVLNPQVRRNH